jgi:multidrug resistance efflux pump
VLAPLLHVQAERDQGPWARGLRRWGQRWRALTAAQRKLWLAATPLVPVALAAVMVVPLDHQVAAASTLQGRVQRAVVSPLDGYLKTVHVRAGDSVKAGDVLAELVDDDLRLELRRRQTEVSQHESAYGDAMARQDRNALVQAEARAGEARAQLGLVEAQLARTRLLAPFDGQVIAGDLQQQLAAPLQRGELLFTLAPTRELRLLLKVDERDSAHVRPGQTGAVTFSALPEQRFNVVVERLSPVAQAADGRNVFEAEARLLAAQQDLLRPGMQGVAQLQAGKQPLGWLLLHPITDWLRLQWWRWIG